MWKFERFRRAEECPPWTSSCRSTYDIKQSLASWSCDSEPCPVGLATTSHSVDEQIHIMSLSEHVTKCASESSGQPYFDRKMVLISLALFVKQSFYQPILSYAVNATLAQPHISNLRNGSVSRRHRKLLLPRRRMQQVPRETLGNW